MKKLLLVSTATVALFAANAVHANDGMGAPVTDPTISDLVRDQQNNDPMGYSRILVDQDGNLVKLDKQEIHVNIRNGQKGFAIINTGRNEYKIEVQEKDGKAVLLSTPQLLANLQVEKNGWVKTEYGKWQYYRHGEALPAGWAQIEGKWYFFDPSHDMKNGGWEFINGKWYYLSESGAMLTGWQHLDGHWYYLNTSGDMETGWVKDNGTWYYLDKSGVMKSNTWFKVGDKWYFAKYSGALAVDTTIDGYRVNENGEWV